MTAALPLPGISVVTPVYNMVRYIDETIVSVTSQLGISDQYLIVDDGSTDGSGAILRRQPPNVEILTQSNQGEVAAVNAGVAAARHDIIGVVNADDPVLPGLFAAVRQTFAADEHLAAVYPDWLKVDANGNTIAAVTTYEFDYQYMLARHYCIPGPGAFFRRSLLSGEPVRDQLSNGISDYDFWLRFGRRGAKIRRLPATLACWRLHPAGTTVKSQGSDLAQTKIEVVERLFSMPDLSDEIRKLRRQALSAAYYQAALVGLRSRDVPSLRYAIKSFMLVPRWTDDSRNHNGRSLRHLVYAALQPLSGTLHDLAGPLLPPHYRHNALLNQTFGFDVSSTD